MNTKWLEILACPECGADLSLAAVAERAGDAIVEGELRCTACAHAYPVRRRVPRFVEPDQDYAESFGWQWQRFHQIQRDSYTGTSIVRDRILSRTGWGPEEWRERRVLECGCGSGNDTEVLATLAGSLVSIDISAAVDAMPPEILALPNVLVLRADLRRAPLKPGSFDVVYCHRVLQHTPDPGASFRAIAGHERPGGRLFVHTYDTHWRTRTNYRYWLRPLLRPFSHPTIFRLIRLGGPLLHPLAGLFQRWPPLRRIGSILIPFTNHDRRLRRAGSKLSRRDRYEYGLVLTFDHLAPRYDIPSSPEAVRRWFDEAGFEQVVIRRRRPVAATGTRPRATPEPVPPEPAAGIAGLG
jgi:SAM-dependent methyltransferase